MAQKYRIYINDSTLFITDRRPTKKDKIQEIVGEGFEFIPFYEKIKKSKGKDYYIATDEPSVLFKAVKKELLLIKAAGGLVTNVNGEYLFIFRNKKWDLPKGKVEEGEKVKVTAVREVEEECGVKIEKRNKRICKTYHIYEMGGKVVLKRTSWYRMRVLGNPKLIPQVEEGITKAVWFKCEEISKKIKNTYPLIIDVLNKENLI